MTEASKGVVKLRELLFDEEAQRLASLDDRLAQVDAKFAKVGETLTDVQTRTDQEQKLRTELTMRMDAVFSRAGTRERFQESIAEVLDDALVIAEQRNHKQVARAVAPLVVTTVKTELRNSQDEMVEALYPITGRLVQAYVASAMRELYDKVNRRLAQNPLTLRMRSIATGRPVSELALAAEADLEIEEVFLIRRGSGQLISRWPSLRPLSNQDIHMGGILSSITDFANHAFEDEGGHIRSFEADTFQIFLRASPMYIIAAKCSGTAPPGFEKDFDDAFFATLEQLDGSAADIKDAAPPALDTMATTLKQRLADVHEVNRSSAAGFGVLKVLTFLLVVPLLTWLTWSAYTALEEMRVSSAATRAVADIRGIRGYQPEIDVGYRGATVVVTGLMPNTTTRNRLLAGVTKAVPETTRVIGELGTIPEANVIDTRPEIARLSGEVAALQRRAQVEAARSDLRRNVSLAGARLDAALADLAALRTRTDLPTATLSPVLAVRDRAAAMRVALTSLSQRLETQQPDVPGLLAQVDRDLEAQARGANEMLAQLDLDPVVVASASGVAGQSIAASETLALGTERIAVAVSALRQTPVIKPPPSPPRPPQVAQPTPVQRLQNWASDNAVFFSNGTQFRQPTAVASRLDVLARLMRDARRLVRLVGYTDERGGLQRNNTLSLARAERVRDELIDRGVPAGLLVVVGRAGNGVDISTETGERSPNRRVEFEVGFAGEGSP